MINNRGFIHAGIAILFILGVTLIIGIYWYYQKQVSTPNNPNQIKVQLAPNPTIEPATTKINLNWNTVFDANNYVKAPNGWSVLAERIKNSEHLSLDLFVKAYYGGDLGVGKQKVNSQEEAMIGQYKGYFLEVFGNPAGQIMEAMIQIDESTMVRVIGLPPIPIKDSVDIDKRLPQDKINEFKQILSDFEFIDQ